MVSGLRQVVLALLTLSNDGCRSLHRHNMAAEREIKKRKETEMEARCTRTEDGEQRCQEREVVNDVREPKDDVWEEEKRKMERK